MKIIIAGDGKVGLALTRLLSEEGHDLVTIDTNREVLERSAQLYDVMAVVGNCATMATLREANVEQADLLIAATSADEINLLCCLTARKLNPSLHTIARVRSPEYLEQLYLMREDFGLSMLINPEREAAKEIFRLLKIPGFLKRETFAKGRVEIVELRVLENSLLENVSLSRLPEVLSGCRVLVCAVIRGGKVIIPSGDTILRRGDHIYVTAPVAVLSELVKRLGIPQKKIRHAMLIGGGRVSYYLAQSLLGAGVRVKIIEQKPERCQQLASMLPRAYIIEGDGSSQSVLETEASPRRTRSSRSPASTSRTSSCRFTEAPRACRTSSQRSTGWNRPAMLENLSVGSVVSPKELCCARHRAVRARHAEPDRRGGHTAAPHRRRPRRGAGVRRP